MSNFRSVAAALLILALAIIIGLHLGLFWTSGGQVIIGEPNKVLLILECVMAGGIFVFGIERLFAAIRSRTARHED